MGAEPQSTDVDSRRVGEANVTIIRDATFYWAPEIQVAEADVRRAMPETNSAGEIAIDLNVAHIQWGDVSLLVDLGFARQTSDGQRRDPRIQLSKGVVSGLASIGVTPDDITHVVITHSHGDHFEGATIEQHGRRVATFPRARYLINRAEWEVIPQRRQPDSSHAMHFGTLERLGQLDLVDGQREIAPGITMVHAPGESPGHSIVRVRSGGESFFYLGDLFHHPCEVEHLDWVSPGRDRPRSLASRELLIKEASRDRALLVYTHHKFPGWGRITASNGGYRWESV